MPAILQTGSGLSHCHFRIWPLKVERRRVPGFPGYIDTKNKKRTWCPPKLNLETSMPHSAEPNPQADADALEAAADQAIAACGGDARETVKALLVANEYLESEISELMKAVSHAYARGRLRPYNG
jgi:hypothetical protein